MNQPIRLQWIAPNPRLHRWLWLNSLDHKTKQRDRNASKILTGREDRVHRGRKELRAWRR